MLMTVTIYIFGVETLDLTEEAEQLKLAKNQVDSSYFA